MTDQQKKVLFWVGSLFVVVLGAFFGVSTVQKLSNPQPDYYGSTVQLTGEGRASSKSDVAFINISINTEGKTSKLAQDSNSTKSKKVVEFLKKQGVAEEDIKSTYYNISPKYQYDYSAPVPYPAVKPVSQDYYGGQTISVESYPVPYPTGTNKIVGYQAVESFEIKVRDFEKVGIITDGVVTAGATQVDGVRFDFENRDSVLKEARKKAIEDAKSKAKDLQDQTGIKLGKLIQYYDNSTYPQYGYDTKSYSDGYTGGIYPSINPGQQELTIQVTLMYQIK